MNIIVASKNQLSVVRDLAYKIWPDAYKKILSTEQLNYMLELIYNIDSLEKQLHNGHVFLLVEDDNGFIGFASYELNCNNSNKTKLQKIYVLPEIQGRGVGRFLIDYILKKVEEAQNTALFLNVNKFNKAKDFYENYGFQIIKEEVIDIGSNYVMDDYVMEKTL
ncbi:GNAT family N-acetyltransferase [Flavobacterium sp.]|uniref:GNAT family N-acetyltransferase n=1 Tax=Flavobacterium sp. TaxID=239 RepID=UPI002628554D|nr:GNAT family N-acetyltransferase [Flavobacterium sp.]